MSAASEGGFAFDPERLAQRLAKNLARSCAQDADGESATDRAGWRMAAVAAVLRASEHELDVLLMRRTEREGDRWSGQISLPGGHAEEGDADLCATAVRETHEELGLQLDREARFLGAMATIRGRARGGFLDLGIAPHVFFLEQAVEPVPGPEADEAFWFPLSRAATGDLDSVYPYRHEGVVAQLPCWEFEGRTVWGLTHRMLCGLLGVLLGAPGSDAT